MHAILYTDDQIKLGDIRKECREQQWVPVLTYIDSDKTTTVVCFNELKTAYSFARRNLDKKWVQGSVSLMPDDIDWIENKGWKIEILDFPKKYKDRFHIGFEIVWLSTKPDVIYTK